jgi:hypothetical protein
MSLLTRKEKITNSIGYLKYFKYSFGADQQSKVVEIDDKLSLIDFTLDREDLNRVLFHMEEKNRRRSLNLNGTFVLYTLEKTRPVVHVFEMLEKFLNLSLAVQLLTSHDCKPVVEMSYDNSEVPTKYYDISDTDTNDIGWEKSSHIGKELLKRLRVVYKSIDKYTKWQSINTRDFSRINNALRFYSIAQDTHWELMKLVLLISVLESLFSDGGMEIAYKIRIRSAYLLVSDRDSSDERIRISDIIKHGYDIRSKFLHGGNVEDLIIDKRNKKKIHEYGLTGYLPELKRTIEFILTKILEDEKLIAFFSNNNRGKNKEKEEALFFEKLVF